MNYASWSVLSFEEAVLYNNYILLMILGNFIQVCSTFVTVINRTRYDKHNILALSGMGEELGGHLGF